MVSIITTPSTHIRITCFEPSPHGILQVMGIYMKFPSASNGAFFKQYKAGPTVKKECGLKRLLGSLSNTGSLDFQDDKWWTDHPGQQTPDTIHAKADQIRNSEYVVVVFSWIFVFSLRIIDIWSLVCSFQLITGEFWQLSFYLVVCKPSTLPQNRMLWSTLWVR